MSPMKVTLSPHIGIKSSPVGPVEVEHDQWVVHMIRDGRKVHCGYMRKAPGAPLLWVPYYEEAVSLYGMLIVEEAQRLAAEARDEALAAMSGATVDSE